MPDTTDMSHATERIISVEEAQAASREGRPEIVIAIAAIASIALILGFVIGLLV
jgi:hypothetical protein